MKTASYLIALITLATLTAQADPGTTAIRRARELNNQNNVRQDIAAPTPQNTATPAPAARPLPTDPVSKLKADLGGLLNATVTPEARQQFTRDLLAAARGSQKPTPESLGKFTESLAKALSGKTLGATEQSRLVQDINLALNGASLSAQRMSEVTSDVQAILQVAGAPRGAASIAANNLGAITAEMQKATAK